ncbi:MAG TPA: carboxypeptidase-like regulatory domain-containing protein [Gemmatimonadales bacterium]|nr:carboxypeptidase-like regulatory domain-containing protein [Gemmatimonadales bacterium]
MSPVLAVAVLLAACGEAKSPLNPGVTGRLATTMANHSGSTAPNGTCSFNTITTLVGRYFPSLEAKAVKTLVSSMQLAKAGTTNAQSIGFDILVHVANNVKAGNADVTDGGALVNDLIACMYSNAADLPAVFPEDFSVALDPAQHGAFEVRGGATDATDPALNRPLAAPFSGVNPITGGWSDLLTGNPAPDRILLYGRPGSTATSYDWKVVPRSTVFAGAGAMVGLCLDVSTNAKSLMHEENVGLLPFADAAFLDPVSCSSSLASAGKPGLLKQLANTIGSFFVPKSLYGNPGGLAGSTSGIHSEFGPLAVDSGAPMAFVVQPSNVKVNAIISPAVQVLVTDAKTGDPIPNVAVTVTANTNNGTPAFLNGTLTQITNGSGIATFGDLSQVKPGGYLLAVTGAVGGRPAIQVNGATSTRFNVHP